MLVPGLAVIVFVVLVFILLFIAADRLPNPYQRYFAYFFLVVSSIELVFIIWILGYVAISDWTLWGLSFNDFWKEQLSAIYFIKEWLYSWFWNDLLNIVFVFLPAVVFLTIRTALTTFLGLWALASSRRKGLSSSGR
ncbi:MAG: hypothetical protein ACR2QZ_00735 [Woeseiaceae bacterium]